MNAQMRNPASVGATVNDFDMEIAGELVVCSQDQPAKKSANTSRCSLQSPPIRDTEGGVLIATSRVEGFDLEAATADDGSPAQGLRIAGQTFCSFCLWCT